MDRVAEEGGVHVRDEPRQIVRIEGWLDPDDRRWAAKALQLVQDQFGDRAGARSDLDHLDTLPPGTLAIQPANRHAHERGVDLFVKRVAREGLVGIGPCEGW